MGYLLTGDMKNGIVTGIFHEIVTWMFFVGYSSYLDISWHQLYGFV